MSKVDVVKETIAYLKFWPGVMVVSDITLVVWLTDMGWMLSSYIDFTLKKSIDYDLFDPDPFDP